MLRMASNGVLIGSAEHRHVLNGGSGIKGTRISTLAIP